AHTINGYANVRNIPITEESFTSSWGKQEDLTRTLRISDESRLPLACIDQLERNTGETTFEAPDTIEEEEGDVEGTVVGSDYTIKSPVFTKDGFAESEMTTSTVDYSSVDGSKFPGLINPLTRELYDTLAIKKYTIYPVLEIRDSAGETTVKQYLPEQVINWTPPINIVSEYEGSEITYLRGLGEGNTFGEDLEYEEYSIWRSPIPETRKSIPNAAEGSISPTTTNLDPLFSS
ncbi:unnamed protein product, partial [marine sediment metagenome]